MKTVNQRTALEITLEIRESEKTTLGPHWTFPMRVQNARGKIQPQAN